MLLDSEYKDLRQIQNARKVMTGSHFMWYSKLRERQNHMCDSGLQIVSVRNNGGNDDGDLMKMAIGGNGAAIITGDDGNGNPSKRRKAGNNSHTFSFPTQSLLKHMLTSEIYW